MNLTIEQMREIVGGAPEWAFGYDIIDDEYFTGADIQDGYSIDHMEGCVCVDDLRAALADHDRTDHCSDIKNHISPTTVVIEK
ncbi:hypothetical protein [Acinetobacter indicus]|uniref:hypothetical protein n=1 Tax=Acinetobacter indicus TaxID=756892 RepID=UPI0014439110|nr:hypothetical protein [Acinetobacter indicus]